MLVSVRWEGWESGVWNLGEALLAKQTWAEEKIKIKLFWVCVTEKSYSHYDINSSDWGEKKKSHDLLILGRMKLLLFHVHFLSSIYCHEKILRKSNRAAIWV